MLKWIRSLSRRTELVVVVVAAFGLFILNSLLTVGAQSPPPAITLSDLQFLPLFELCMLVPIGIFLRMRGWQWRDVSATPVGSDVVIGLVLAGVATLLTAVAMFLAQGAGAAIPEVKDVVPFETGLGWPLVLGVSTVNGFYEETLVCGYLMTAMRNERSWWPAIHTSTAVRIAYHLYQGNLAVASIIPFGLLFGWFYARTGRLWPLIIAHVLLDILALAPYA